MKKILISACLAGDRVRYDGKQVILTDKRLLSLNKDGLLVKVCPEVLSGMKIPRPAARIVNGNGLDVLNGRAKVIDINGQDVSDFFIRGAEYALSLAEKHHIEIAVLKEKSPSCGVRQIYNGVSDIGLISGFGVTTAILRQNGVKVYSGNEIDQVKTI